MQNPTAAYKKKIMRGYSQIVIIIYPFDFEIIAYSFAVGKNIIERSHAPSTLRLPVKASATSTAQYHNHNTDTNAVKIHKTAFTRKTPCDSLG